MYINNNSMAIIILCSHLCVGDNVVPFEPKEWTALADLLIEKDIQPYEILGFCVEDFKEKLLMENNMIERIERLIARSASITFELEKMSNVGIKIVTRADSDYPKNLKNQLGKQCPPLFYCVGNLKLLNERLIGFVGSRTINSDDINFTKRIVKKAVERGLGIVSGGAKGIDSISTNEAILCGGFAVEYISDSLTKKIKSTQTINAIRNDKLLIISVVKPDAGFNTGIAMMRNRYIYASTIATVVVKSDLEKGGTWAGANENLKKKWTNEFCWNNKNYKGNLELIKLGAIPINENWDVEVNIERPKKIEEPKQMSLFDNY